MRDSARPNLESSETPIVPLTISALNCERALGLPWRWVRRKARELNVPIWAIDRKSCIPARELLDALQRAGLAETSSSAPALMSDSDAAVIRRMELATGVVEIKPKDTAA